MLCQHQIKRVLVIGDGSMAATAVSQLAAIQGLRCAGWMYHAHDRWSERRAPALLARRALGEAFPFDHVADGQSRSVIAAMAPDLILNVNSFDIFPPDLIGAAPDGIINFHNGPLPRYRGLNIPSWAIINGESSHGVTWHRVEAGIDTGPTVARAAFEIAPGETAISLTFKCIEQGLALLPRLLASYLEGPLRASGQPMSEAEYFPGSKLPNQGFIDPCWPGEVIDRFLRGLYFHPYPNTFIRPRARLDGNTWVSGEYGEFVPGPSNGEVGALATGPGNGLELNCKDGIVRLFELRDQDGSAISAATDIPLVTCPGKTVRLANR